MFEIRQSDAAQFSIILANVRVQVTYPLVTNRNLLSPDKTLMLPFNNAFNLIIRLFLKCVLVLSVRVTMCDELLNMIPPS
jgi:hypothetical protein